MAKEKRAKEGGSEKKAKKRKTAGDGELAAPIAPLDTEQKLIIEKKTVLSPIAHPLADEKLKKRALKLVKHASKGKQLKRGVKEVVKALRKDTKG